MKTTIALILVLSFVCAAQADMLIITSKDVNIKKEKVEIGTQCVEWDESGREPQCVKEIKVYTEVATLSWEGDEISSNAK